jgi:SAM-dependent methyltransferase
MQNPKINKCRVCGGAELLPCFDIGEQYLSSIFPGSLDYRDKLKKYPLDMVLCRRTEKTCGLLQLGHDLDLSEMYEAYPYTSSANAAMKKVLQDVAASGEALGHLRQGDTVLDIGCNDGTLLSFLNGKGYKLIGIDAAQNIQPVFASPDYRFERGFFGKKKFESITDAKAKLIFSIAMFYHLSDPVAFSREAADCMEDDGAWIIQMAYLPAMLETNMYDNIVHEHNGYYGIETMQWVMEQAGLEIFDALLNDVYGGSFRVFVKKKKSRRFERTERLRRLLEEERKAAVYDLKTYEAFDRRIQKTREDLRALVAKIRGEGKKIWAYGASTKGNTILQYCGLSTREIEAAADANAFKFGKHMVGSDIPIRDESEMRRAKPDYLLALPYGFVKAFMEREADLVRQGTKFIVPLPQVRVLP